MAERGKIYTRKIIAQVLGLSERHVKRLTDDGHIEEHTNGTYKLLPAVQGYIKYLRLQIADDDSASEYSVEKAKLTKLRREDAEMTMRLRRNELHSAEVIEFVLVNALTAFKAKVETLPYSVLPNLLNMPGDTTAAYHFVKVLTAAVSEVLAELPDYEPEMFAADTVATKLLDTEMEGVGKNG